MERVEDSFHKLSLKDSQAYVEMTRILLESGANVNTDWHCGMSPLDIFLQRSCFNRADEDRYSSLGCFVWEVCNSKHLLPLMADVVELLLKHGCLFKTNKGEFDYHVIILRLAAIVANAAHKSVKISEMNGTFSEIEHSFNVKMETLGDMFRCLLLTGSGSS